MATPDVGVLAEVGFSSYSKAVGGKTHDGKNIPSWSDILENSPVIAAGWNAAVEAILWARLEMTVDTGECSLCRKRVPVEDLTEAFESTVCYRCAVPEYAGLLKVWKEKVAGVTSKADRAQAELTSVRTDLARANSALSEALSADDRWTEWAMLYVSMRMPGPVATDKMLRDGLDGLLKEGAESCRQAQTLIAERDEALERAEKTSLWSSQLYERVKIAEAEVGAAVRQEPDVLSPELRQEAIAQAGPFGTEPTVEVLVQHLLRRIKETDGLADLFTKRVKVLQKLRKVERKARKLGVVWNS